MARPTKIITVDPTAGRDISIVGDNPRLVLTGTETEGAFAVIDMLIPPGGGPGPHAHATFQESFYVLEGEIVVRSESGTYIAREGSTVSIPRGGAIHSFKNEAASTAHILCVVVPSGLDDFFKEAGEPVEYGKFLPPPEMNEAWLEKMGALAKKYGQELFPPDYFDKK
jgi:quercetin dioxygenase-like cupin family protein